MNSSRGGAACAAPRGELLLPLRFLPSNQLDQCSNNSDRAARRSIKPHQIEHSKPKPRGPVQPMPQPYFHEQKEGKAEKIAQPFESEHRVSVRAAPVGNLAQTFRFHLIQDVSWFACDLVGEPDYAAVRYQNSAFPLTL
jgi:hypothetical protein